MTHIVRGLKEVNLAETAPWPKPKRLTGAKAAGLAFERKLGKALPGILASSPFSDFQICQGVWLEFQDSSGRGFAQPDFFLLPPTDSILAPQFGLLLECKLSLTARGWMQMEKLYLPLLRRLYRIDFKMIQVCKNLRPGFTQYPILDCIEPLSRDIESKSIWQYLG